MGKLLCAVCIALDYDMPGYEGNQKARVKAAITIAAGTAVCNDHLDCINDGGVIRAATKVGQVVNTFQPLADQLVRFLNDPED